MEDLKKIFMLDKFSSMNLEQKLAVITAIVTFFLTFLFAVGMKLIAMIISVAAFWLATLWVERFGVDVEE